jgi:4-amino-4-deoxy-L-arabinose transferase-like glycosyltransferase
MRQGEQAGGLGRRRGVLIAALIAVAFGARLAANIYLGLDAPPMSDDRDYDQLAWSLAQGEGYTIPQEAADGTLLGRTFITFRPPLYPVFLSLVYRVAGHDLAAVRVIQAGLGALTAGFAFLIGRRLFGEKRGWVAAAIFAVAPADVFFFHGLLTEGLFIPLVAMMIYGFIRLRAAWDAAPGSALPRGATLGWSLWTGAFLGAATLARPVLLLFPPFVLLWGWWTFRRAPRAGGGVDIRGLCGGLFVIMAGAFLVLAPWLWLLHARTGHWVPVTASGGVAFWGGNNIRVLEREHWGRWVHIGDLPFYDELRRAGDDQVVVDRLAWRLGMNFVASNPGKVPQLLIFKLARFWNPWANIPTARKLAYFLTYGLALPWMFAGMVMTFRRDAPEAILHLLIGAFCLSAAIFWGDARMRSGVSPYLWMFAVVALGRTWAFLRRPSGSESPPDGKAMPERGSRA